MSSGKNKAFTDRAREIVVDEYNALLPDDKTHDMYISKDDVNIVWFSKTLQNWKALVATALPDDQLYFEVTYDGDKKRAYVDIYDKIKNVVVLDDPNDHMIFGSQNE